jgi:hypothetical protein
VSRDTDNTNKVMYHSYAVSVATHKVRNETGLGPDIAHLVAANTNKEQSIPVIKVCYCILRIRPLLQFKIGSGRTNIHK